MCCTQLSDHVCELFEAKTLPRDGDGYQYACIATAVEDVCCTPVLQAGWATERRDMKSAPGHFRDRRSANRAFRAPAFVTYKLSES